MPSLLQLDDVSDQAYVEQNAIKIARELQQIKGMDEEEEEDPYRDHVGRRKTIHNLQKQASKKIQFSGNLDAAFRKRIDSINVNGVDLNGNWILCWCERSVY